MSLPSQQIAAQFREWELRGRGYQLFEDRVPLEPVFRPFLGYVLEQRIDDGRKPTFASSLIRKLSEMIAPPAKEEVLEEETDDDSEPESEFEELIEIPTVLPLSKSVPADQMESFLRQVCRSNETLGIELLGTEQETRWQLLAARQAASRVVHGVETNFPGIVCIPQSDPEESSDSLFRAWIESETSFAVVELGLGAEFILPLGSPRGDVLAAVVAALDGLGEEELGLVQILFTPALGNWPESILRAVSDVQGGPLFSNGPDLLRGAQRKTQSPLFAVVVRLVASAASSTRAWEIIADLGSPFSACAKPGSNFFAPLRNDEYPPDVHEEDVLDRASRRSGMLLSLEELIPLISPPVTATSKRLHRETKRTKRAPESAKGLILLGANTHAGTTNEVWLTPEQRVRHCHIIGASGTGKSTLLFNLIRQDIENGQGLAVLDPHGDLVDGILGIIPEERIADVVLIDPSDEEYSVGLNILAAHSDFEKGLLASDLVSVFRRLSTSWGDQMNTVLRNAILAFLESTEGGTLADLRRFLLDTGFRNRFLTTVTDSEIVYYWQKAFPSLTGNKSIGPVVTRLDEFLSRKPIRYMVSQKENRVNFAEVIDGGRILLAKLPQGLIGRENSYLLGSLLLSKLQQMAMSRQRMRESERRDFWCYVDEFHSFITPSMAEILTGARKYRVGLTLAHQELRQLQASDEVSSAVLANAFTRVVFRVGDSDARSLENGFSHFEARDLQNLEIGEAVCRIERSDFDFNLAVRMPEPVADDKDMRREEVIARSRASFARPRGEIEAELRQRFGEEKPNRPALSVSPGAAEEPTASTTVTAPLARTSPVPQSVEKRPETETGSGKNPVGSEATSESAPPAKREPGELGRGGVQHKAICDKISAAAYELGFKPSKIEHEVLGGAGSIDLVLEREGVAIACEINVTSTIDEEIKNARKCLKAGFTRIALICPYTGRLARLEEAVRGCFEPAEAAKISCHNPDDFVSKLREPNYLGVAGVSASTETRRRGWKVKRSVVEVSDEETKIREDVALKALSETLRKPSE